MNAEILAVGSELLLGQIANTNAQFISQRLADLGIDVYYHTVVGDNPDRLKQAINTAKSRASLLIFTGGLGPTKDDLTKETIAEMIGKSLVFDAQALEGIEDYFKKTGRTMTENNRKQALVIEGSKVLDNHHGMAPGMLIKDNTHIYMLFPGPPSEMKPMFVNEAEPHLMDASVEKLVSRVLRFFGIGESALETEIIDLIDQQSNPTIAPLAKEREVTLRLTAKHADVAQAEKLIDEIEAIIFSRVGQYFYGYGEVGLPEVTFQLLKEQGIKVAAAESLTGGLFSQSLTHFSGSSSVLNGSIICYTNRAKESLLGIPSKLLNEDGAVSEACALAMANNVRDRLESDIGISFTGVAGPSKSENKDVGTVYIGLSTSKGTTCFPLRLSGSREAIRHRTIMYGFQKIRNYLVENSSMGYLNKSNKCS